MAKPMSGQPGCSYRVPPRSIQHRPSSRRRSQHPATHPSPHFAAPSSGLLSLLATIAASSATADGSPIPPSFLCPFVDYETSTITSNSPQDNLPPDAIHLPPTSTNRRRNVPDQYQPGPDGRWRRVEAYTLYGSTVCPSCNESGTIFPSVDNQAKPSSSYPVDPSAPSPSTIDILDTLPTGWKPSERAEDRATLILALSLVLAFLICFFIVGCLFWRKNMHRKFRENDVEMKARRQRQDLAPDNDEEAAAEKEIRTKQKMWARATARWKANARYSARQRRGKRIVSVARSIHAQTSSISLQQPHDGLSTAATSPSPSRPLSRQSSIGSIHEASSLGAAMVSSATDGIESSAPSPPGSPFLPSPTLASPPAYHHRALMPNVHFSENPHTTDQELPNLPITPSHAGHVATDDKSLLARLAELASAPPQSPTNSSNNEVSVPVWHDEELVDFAETSHDSLCDPHICSTITSDHPCGSYAPALPFPPPPSKGKMATPAFYDYSFEDLATPESEPEPSAPPFGEGSNAPPLDDINELPSAPPLTEQIGPAESSTNMPEWKDWEPGREELDEGQNEEVGEGATQNHDREEVKVNSYPTPDHQPRSSDSSFDNTMRPVQGPVASDGTPPRYCL